jgi:hypothetical protein
MWHVNIQNNIYIYIYKVTINTSYFHLVHIQYIWTKLDIHIYEYMKYCLINEQECFIMFKDTSANASTNSIDMLPISILYIKKTNEDTTTIDTALL